MGGSCVWRGVYDMLCYLIIVLYAVFICLLLLATLRRPLGVRGQDINTMNQSTLPLVCSLFYRKVLCAVRFGLSTHLI